MRDLVTLIGDFWWLVPLAGAGAVLYRFFGWRGLVAALTFGLAGGLYTKGQRDERAQLERLRQAERLRAIEARKGVENDIAKRNPDDRRGDLSKWVPDDKNPR